MEQLNFFQKPKQAQEQNQDTEKAKLILQGVLQSLHMKAVKITEENINIIYEDYNQRIN